MKVRTRLLFRPQNAYVGIYWERLMWVQQLRTTTIWLNILPFVTVRLEWDTVVPSDRDASGAD